MIVGGLNRDVLTGGDGADTFVFGAPSPASVDQITDFISGVDFLQFTASDLGFAAGPLDPANLVFGTKAVDAHAEFVFDAATGRLLWDSDGIGGRRLALVATFDGGASLTAADIILI